MRYERLFYLTRRLGGGRDGVNVPSLRDLFRVADVKVLV